MSNRKSKTEQQRFSGPELGDLLEEVVAEHGSTAAISAVNRIRSGGVAGFFCREEFEVIVDGTTPAPDPVVADPVVAETTPIVPLAPDPPPIDPPPTRRPPPVFAAPTPPGQGSTDAGFLALLERRLDETSVAEADLALRGARVPRPARTPAVELPIPAPTGPAPAPVDRAARPAVPVGQPAELLSDDQARTSPFWLELQRAQHELASFLPLDSSFVAVIGPLALTTAVVRRLRSGSELASAGVVVLSDRAGIVSEPSWEMVRSGHQLVEVAGHLSDRPTVLVIDVPVERPAWVAPLQNRLRMAGVGLFRHVIPGQPTASELESHRQGSDVPYVFDLVSRVTPRSVVDFIDARHPVASVAGSELTAELLVALRRQVGRDG